MSIRSSRTADMIEPRKAEQCYWTRVNVTRETWTSKYTILPVIPVTKEWAAEQAVSERTRNSSRKSENLSAYSSL